MTDESLQAMSDDLTTPKKEIPESETPFDKDGNPLHIVIGSKWADKSGKHKNPFDSYEAGFWKLTVKAVKGGWVQFERGYHSFSKIDSLEINDFLNIYQPIED